MNLLDGEEPPPDGSESHPEGSTRCVCKRTLTDPVSIAYGLGPDCRKRLGVVPRRPVGVTGVPAWRDCDGQTDLLEEMC